MVFPIHQKLIDNSSKLVDSKLCYSVQEDDEDAIVFGDGNLLWVLKSISEQKGKLLGFWDGLFWTC